MNNVFMRSNSFLLIFQSTKYTIENRTNDTLIRYYNRIVKNPKKWLCMGIKSKDIGENSIFQSKRF